MISIIEKVLLAQEDLNVLYEELEEYYSITIDAAVEAGDAETLTRILNRLPACPLRMKVAGKFIMLSARELVSRSYIGNKPIVKAKPLTGKQLAMYNYWIDKPVPYPSRKDVPLEFQHDNQLYKDEYK